MELKYNYNGKLIEVLKNDERVNFETFINIRNTYGTLDKFIKNNKQEAISATNDHIICYMK